MCIENIRLCFITLGAIYVDTLLLRNYICRIDKGGSTKSREGRHGESNRIYAYKVSLEKKESNMSYDPAHRKCLIGIKTCNGSLPVERLYHPYPYIYRI